MSTTRRFASPTGGRDIVNPQDIAVYYHEFEERVLIQFDDHDGKPVEWRGTPQLARQVAYLLLMAVAKLNGRYVGHDDSSFTVRDTPAVDALAEGDGG